MELGEPVAAIVHDASVLDDPGLVEAIATSAELAGSNARLQARVRAQVADVVASRRRLIRAADDERRRLEGRLHEGAERRLAAVLDALNRAEAAGDTGGEPGARLTRARTQLEQTLDELRELAAGLHPRELEAGGLAGALESLGERSPVPARVEAPADRLPDELEAALYFVASEALANVAKYASATRVAITVTRRDGEVRLSVDDDGVGGADPARGSGLRGLTDRIEALGGRFRVDSPPERGTHVIAELPLDGEISASGNAAAP